MNSAKMPKYAAAIGMISSEPPRKRGRKGERNTAAAQRMSENTSVLISAHFITLRARR